MPNKETTFFLGRLPVSNFKTNCVLLFIYLGYFIAACAAASLAIGTLKGEQDT